MHLQVQFTRSFFVYFLGLICLCYTSVIAQEKLVEGESPSQSTPTVEMLRELIETTREKWDVPGLAVAVVKDDEIVLSQGFGLKCYGETEKVDGDTLFAIASNSKAFTAAGLAILVDEGKVSWDDPVEKYLPWLRLKDPMTRDLRVRDLLCHRSGLGTFSGDLLWWGTSYTPQEVLVRARELEPAAPFRAKYEYSNLMFLAGGLVIEKASGQSWSDFVRGRILSPLGMERTVTSVKQLEKMGNYATPHKTFLEGEPDSGKLVSQPIEWMNWDTMAAAGGIISSADDMSKWLRLQLRRGKLRGEGTLFSPGQSHEMWTAHMPIPVSQNYQNRYLTTHFRAYGLGWSLNDYQGRKIVGHGGGYDGMYSQVVMVPEENLGIVVLTNSMTSVSPAVTYPILDLYLGGPKRDWTSEILPGFKSGRKSFQDRIKKVLEPAVEGTSPSHSLEDYKAHFRCPLYGDAMVGLEEGELVLRMIPNPVLVADLKHLHYDTFAIQWRNESAWFGGGTAHFVADSRGKFVGLELDVPNDDLWFYELKLERVEE